MADGLRRFHQRAFRYVLRPQDRHDMRFALESTRGASGIEQTHLLNLSETGVAFLVAPGTALTLGERIKVEVPIPSGEQMAWWGKVVRLQEHEPHSWFGRDPFHDEPKIMVAVRFEVMPDGHQRAIRKGLEKSFMQAMRDQHYRNWLYYRTLALQNARRVVIWVTAAALAAGLLYYFTRPSGNYRPDRFVPWGEREF